jgi:metal-dependent amidase/aminoacylase/carboxypeptidase family protein
MALIPGTLDPIVISAEIVNNLQTIISRNHNLTENPEWYQLVRSTGNRSNIIPEWNLGNPEGNEYRMKH